MTGFIDVGDFKTSEVSDVVLVVSDVTGNMLMQEGADSVLFIEKVQKDLRTTVRDIQQKIGVEEYVYQFIGGYRQDDHLYGLYYVCANAFLGDLGFNYVRESEIDLAKLSSLQQKIIFCYRNSGRFKNKWFIKQKE